VMSIVFEYETASVWHVVGSCPANTKEEPFQRPRVEVITTCG
jgi:hypothetical protein